MCGFQCFLVPAVIGQTVADQLNCEMVVVSFFVLMLGLKYEI